MIYVLFLGAYIQYAGRHVTRIFRTIEKGPNYTKILMRQIQKKLEATEPTQHLVLQRKGEKVLPEPRKKESCRTGNLERNKDMCAMDPTHLQWSLSEGAGM